MRHLWFAFLLLTMAATCAAGDELQFNRDIRPILSVHCYHCHGPDEKHREGELQLDRAEGIAHALGDSDLAKNVAWQRLTSTDPDEQMPPPDAPTKIKPEELALLKKWIGEGAKFQGHWAFIPPTMPEVPKVKNSDWVRNPIDAFVLSRLEAEGLQPRLPDSREQLLRRLTLDLTGLPPTLAELDVFLADEDPKAYEKAVDRLLASPRFGERLAVPWLDAARYADTNGFSIDDHRDMWLWREWVIDAFNRNVPYNQFVVRQLAGDLLPNTTDGHRLATGFLRNSMNTHEGGTIPAEYRVIYIADKIDTVSTVFMGLTMRCAQCHSHKYDPITQQDYYKFFAFFDTAHEPGSGAHNGNTEPTLRSDGLLTDAATFKADTKQRIATLRRYQLHPPELLKPRADWEAGQRSTAKGELATAINTPVDDRTDKHWQTINSEFAKTTQLWNRHFTTINREIAVLDRDLKAGKSSVMVMKEQGPRQTFLLTRGQYDQPDKSQPLKANTPPVLGALSAESETAKSRLDLAQWLTSPRHPLTARVAVNRHWQMLFGRGLVATPNDFGSQGAYPTHPELLDWLALQYIASGWDTKQLIKTMVMSATYRQSSSAPRELYERDPQNELLARAPRFRLPAEFIRDGALAVAGKLDDRIGGPSVYPSQPHGLWREVSHFGYGAAFSAQAFYPSDDAGQHRRSMYTFWKRTSPPPAMIAFDAPTREVCSVQRSRTNTPLQALVLLNDPEYVGAARQLAAVVMKEVDAAPDRQVANLFRRSTSRQPDDAELAILLRRFNDALEIYQKDDAARQALVIDGSAEHAAMTVVASIVLNLDEVLTRE